MTSTSTRLASHHTRKWTLTRGNATRSSAEARSLPAPWVDAAVGPDTSKMIGGSEFRRSRVIDALASGALRRIRTYEEQYGCSLAAAALVIDPADSTGIAALSALGEEFASFDIGRRLIAYAVICLPAEVAKGIVAMILPETRMPSATKENRLLLVIAAGGATVLPLETPEIAGKNDRPAIVKSRRDA